MEEGQTLHVVLFPWLALGHISPFFHLAKLLAQKGLRVSFVSTPKNLSKLPNLSSSRINFVSLPFPRVPNLPQDAECSVDMSYSKQQLLKAAFDLLRSPLTDFLRSSKPDWIIYDYASHWLPPIAADLGISSAFFCLFTAAMLSFVGPISRAGSRSRPEDFTVVPDWVNFESNIAFRLHEITHHFEKDENHDADDGPTADNVRFCVAVQESDLLVMRSCPEFEPEWFSLLRELHKTTIVPVGFLPPIMGDEEAQEDEDDDDGWVGIKEWLDKQKVSSVVYAAFGTEARLNREQLNELAIGLEESGLAFFWVLRSSYGLTLGDLEIFRDEVESRVKGKGMIYIGWVPQVKILRHDSVGGLLTHCGWNSVIEGLALGRVLIMFPMLNDQGLNARLLQGKKVGVEIPRNEEGRLVSGEVAESLRSVMVAESGELYRRKAKEMRGLFGDRDKNGRYVDEFVSYMKENRRRS